MGFSAQNPHRLDCYNLEFLFIYCFSIIFKHDYNKVTKVVCFPIFI